jgi:hypothetical protein
MPAHRSLHPRLYPEGLVSDFAEPRQCWEDLVKGWAIQAFVGAIFYKIPDAAAPFFAYVCVVRSTVNLTGRKVASPRSIGAVLDHPFEAILSVSPLIPWLEEFKQRR